MRNYDDSRPLHPAFDFFNRRDTRFDGKKFNTILLHKNCGGELLFIAKIGVDVRQCCEVVALSCEKCSKVVTSLEDKNEIEHRYELVDIKEIKDALP